MEQGAPTINYEQFWSKPFDEWSAIFEEISPENRALVMKTHVERWLEANRTHWSRQLADSLLKKARRDTLR